MPPTYLQIGQAHDRQHAAHTLLFAVPFSRPFGCVRGHRSRIRKQAVSHSKHLLGILSSLSPKWQTRERCRYLSDCEPHTKVARRRLRHSSRCAPVRSVWRLQRRKRDGNGSEVGIVKERTDIFEKQVHTLCAETNTRRANGNIENRCVRFGQKGSALDCVSAPHRQSCTQDGAKQVHTTANLMSPSLRCRRNLSTPAGTLLPSCAQQG